jgi:succinate dehydrogenase subunit D
MMARKPTLGLLHVAHRFRYALYDGLQLQHLQEVLLLFSYGAAIVGSVAAGVLPWRFG